MQEKWLIATDLDGTLFGSDYQLSQRTIDTLRAVEQTGHAIVVVTGRSRHSALERLAALPASARIVCSNGAYECHRYRDVNVWSEPIAAKTAIGLRQQILENLTDASFGWESANGLCFEQQFVVEAGGTHTLEAPGIVEEFGTGDVLKLYARSPQLVRGDLQEKLIPIVNGQAEVSTSGAPFVELTAQGVDKASGLALVAADLGYTAKQTIAFGDNLNDIPMLRWSGTSVAMGNAHDEVKAIASLTTQSNTDDGVAAHLQAMLENGVL